MNPLMKFIEKNQISRPKIVSVLEKFNENPLAAMVEIQSWNIPSEDLQELINQLMFEPQWIKITLDELQLDSNELLEKIKTNLDSLKES
jgi:hypothetical protein